MTVENAFMLARPARWIMASLAMASALAVAGSAAQAQQQPPRTAQQRPAAQPPKPATPPAQSQAPAPAATQPGQATETPPLVFSPWTKVCGKDQNAANKEVCFTVKEARLDTGQFVASAGLIEVSDDQKKLFRVTLPLGLLLRHGTRMIVDQNQPMMGVYNFCLPNGCWADFEVNQDFVGKLKKGQSIVLQAFNMNGQIASFAFPLADFAKINEGAGTDPKALEEQQKKLQEELQRRADEARKKLEQQQSTPPAPAR